ncbi:MAG: ParA family protein [Planctomycetota bacterium]|jgi:cellulose biosynthesis protein BcsQ
MSVPVVAFFNNKGGVGKTSLVYHLSWMYSEIGTRVLAADLDPQANLTAAFLDDEGLEAIWADPRGEQTVFGCVEPLKKGVGDVLGPAVTCVSDFPEYGLGLLAGDLALTTFEDDLSRVWPDCMDGKERAFRVTSAFWRVMQKAAELHRADVVLMDVGPNLGAINRACLISADFVVVPLGPDLFSIQGLQNLGPALRTWREEWHGRSDKNPAPDLALPEGNVRPVGYIVLQHSVRLDRPVEAYEKWIARIPGAYREHVMAEKATDATVKNDPYCLAMLKHYRSLMPMAQEVRKPMFLLKPADGAIGAHVRAVRNAYVDFEALAREIATRIGTALPS